MLIASPAAINKKPSLNKMGGDIYPVRGLRALLLAERVMLIPETTKKRGADIPVMIKHIIYTAEFNGLNKRYSVKW